MSPLTPYGEQIADEIRELIRQGVKTSEIISRKDFPLQLVKDIKAEELDLQRRNDRAKVRQGQSEHMNRKREIHHQAFLKRMGADKKSTASPSENNSVAPAPVSNEG